MGVTALAVLVLLGQGLLAWSWTHQQRASAGTAVIVAAAAVACDITLLARESTQIGDLAGVVGVALVVVVLYQLTRRRIRAAQHDPNGVAAPGASPDAACAGCPGKPARVTVDMASALSGVGWVALLAAVLALDVRDGGAGRAFAVAGLLGVGVGVGASRLVAVVVAAGRPAAGQQARRGVGVAATAGVAAGAAVGAALGVLADISLSEGVAAAVAGAAAALVVEAGLARGLAGGDGAGEVPASAPPAPATISAGSMPASLVLMALLPFAVAAPVVYLVGRLVLP